METARWPIDYEALNKGDVIPASRIEEVMRVSRTDQRAYQLALLNLKDRMERDLWNMGRRWTLRITGEEIVVLTDAEASQYNDHQIGVGMRRMFRSHARQLSVDVSMLTDDERAEHERRVEVQGKRIQAIRNVNKQIRLESHRRTTPGLMLTGDPEGSAA